MVCGAIRKDDTDSVGATAIQAAAFDRPITDALCPDAGDRGGRKAPLPRPRYPCAPSRPGVSCRMVEPVITGDTHRQACRRRPGVRSFPSHNSKSEALAEALRVGLHRLAPVIVSQSNP